MLPKYLGDVNIGQSSRTRLVVNLQHPSLYIRITVDQIGKLI